MSVITILEMATGLRSKNKEELIDLVLEHREKEKVFLETERKLSERIDEIENKLAGHDFRERLVKVERNLNLQAQYSRRECIELVGIPDSVEDKQIENKVVELFQHAGVKVNNRSFHAVHRLNGKSTVIAKCVNRKDSVAILRAKKTLRELNDDNKAKLGVDKVWVNESLCPPFRRLFGICNSLFKSKQISSSYTMNGTIKIKVAGGSTDGATTSISHINDLYNLFGFDAIDKMVQVHAARFNRTVSG